MELRETGDEESASAIVDSLAQLSFVWYRRQGGFTYHEDIRAELLEWWQLSQERKSRYLKLSRRLYRYFRHHAESSVDQDEALYHQFAYDRDGAFEAFEKTFQESLQKWDLARAEHLLTLVKERARLLSEEQKLWLLYHEAELRFQLDDWQTAISILSSLVEEELPEQLAALALNKLGLSLDFSKEWDRASASYEKALRFSQKIEDLSLVAEIYHNMGIVHRRRQEWQKAIKMLQKSLEVRRNIGDLYGLSQCYNNIGRVYRNTEEWAKALEFFEASLAIRRELDDLGGIAQCYNNIGVVLNQMGEYDKALDILRRSYEIRERIGHVMGLNYTRYNLAMVFGNQRRYSEAAELLEKVVQVDKQLEHFDLEFDLQTLERVRAKLAGDTSLDVPFDEHPRSYA